MRSAQEGTRDAGARTTRPAPARSWEPARSRPPAPALRAGEPAPAAERVLELQRLAGNRAVGGLLARRRPRSPAPAVQRTPPPAASGPAAASPACETVRVAPPTELPVLGNWTDPSWVRIAPAPGGLASIRSAGGAGPTDMAHTPWVQPQPPTVQVTPLQRPDGRWSSTLSFTPAGRLPAAAVSPGTGVHEVPAGSQVHAYVLSPQIADLIRRGEAEHVSDFSYAQLLVSQTVTRVLYRLAGHRPPVAATREQAVECAWSWLRDALPPQLRWYPTQRPDDVRFLWLQRQNTLAGPTISVRDLRESWHRLGRRSLSPAERRRAGVPAGAAVAYEVTAGRSEIGVHPPQEILDPVWQSVLPSFA